LIAAPVFAVQAGGMTPFVLLLSAMLAAAGGLARALDQRFVVWPGAILPDLVVLLYNLLVLRHRTPAEPWGAVAVNLVFFVVSAGGPLARAVRDRAPTTIFEMLQTSAAFLLALVPASQIASGLA